MHVDSLLIGTRWVKVAGRHTGQKGEIDRVGPRGPRMKFVGKAQENTHLRTQPFMRLDWAEIGNAWQPLAESDRQVYLRWTSGAVDEMKVTVDENLTVVKVEKEEMPITIEPIPVSDPDFMDLVDCVSTYHHGDRAVEKAHAKLSKWGNWNCDSCRARRVEYERERKRNQHKELTSKTVTYTPETEKVEYIPPMPVYDTPTKQANWRVVIVQQVVHEVYADDYLDAAARFDGQGEIIRVERL